MALWLTKSGGSGEYEQKFLSEGKIYLTWNGLNRDLSKLKDLPEYYAEYTEVYPDTSKGTIQNWARQGAQFTQHMQQGDWVVMPSKINPTLHFGKITSPYVFNSEAENPFFHSRKIEWFAVDIPRSRFDQDILYSFGAFLTVCRITRNNAEERVKEMAKNKWQAPIVSPALLNAVSPIDDLPDENKVDLEELATDQIAKQVLAKLKGYGLQRLVKALLEAQGYTVHMPPEGADKGVDLLAAPGSLGFDSPRICVQIKGTDSPVERTVLDQLVGVMQNFGAERGLLVSWGGFKQSIEKERAQQFFKVRLWSREDVLQNLYLHYGQLPAELRAEIPLKQIWTLNLAE